jgi:flagellar protein FliO/FliZ
MKLKKLLIVFILFSGSISFSDEKLDAEISPPLTEHPSSSEAPPPSEQPLPSESNQGVPPPLPSSKEMTTSYEGAFVRMLVTLTGLVLLVFATFWILRRLGKGKFRVSSGNGINILERRALSPKSMLYILQIDNKKVLISESQVEVRALTSFEELEERNE